MDLYSTYKGAYRNVEASGREVEWKGVDIYTVAEGKIFHLTVPQTGHLWYNSTMTFTRYPCLIIKG